MKIIIIKKNRKTTLQGYGWEMTEMKEVGSQVKWLDQDGLRFKINWRIKLAKRRAYKRAKE